MRAVRIVSSRRFAAACIGVVASVLLACLAFAFGETQEEHTVMKRRQQGILTGMPFMANITPRTFIDDAGRKLYVAKAPTRVVSLAPSITEMLFALGLDEQIVGVTDVGGIFLMVADTMARTFFVPSEVPVGIITALAGGPFFVYLLVWRKDRLV
ncbi:MAG: hypothetical protein E8D43_02180 [Nitrospira sp.]|nr:MAG: hypothetical protein E8D43_02180 [Nitrospira sp.]